MRRPKELARIWRATVVLVLVVLGMTALGGGLSSASPGEHLRVSLAAKTIHCKSGQVTVRIKKRLRCRALGVLRVGPGADERSLEAHTALAVSLGRARDRRGRRVVSLSSLLHRVRPNALHALEAAVGQGLAKIDGIIARPASRGGTSRALIASDTAGCAAQPGATGTESFKESGFEAKVDVGNGTAQIGVELGGKGLKIVVDLSLCDETKSFKAPECPTADGALSATDESHFGVSIRAFEHGKPLFSQVAHFEAQTTIGAQNGDDAKLDYFDIKHVFRTNIAVGDSRQAFGPISMKLTFTGNTRVDMRTGVYDPSKTTAEVEFQAAGVAEQDLKGVEAGQSAKLQKQASEDFAKEITKVIEKLHAKEPGWNNPNACTSLSFAPPRDTLTLRKGEEGSVSPTIQSNQGGSPPTATWTVSGQENASFTPASSSGNPSKVNYTVTNAGKGVIVGADFKAVSRAGVSERSWTQNTKAEPPPPAAFVGPVSGSATYEPSELGEGSNLKGEWSGNVELRQLPPGTLPPEPVEPAANYAIASGSIVYSYKGHINECTVIGSGSIDLAAQLDLMGLSVLSLFNGTPHTYKLWIPMPLLVQVHGITSNCAEPEANGKDFAWTPAASLPLIANSPLPGGPLGEDWSMSGSGSGSAGPGAPQQTWAWTLTPSS